MTAETVHVIAGLEASVVVYLAGNAAERRALQGSAPGWRRWRTPEELRAIHEAGHAIAQWARGDFVWKLSIMVDKNVRVGKSGYMGGFSSAGITPEPPGRIEFPARVDCDLRNANNLIKAYKQFITKAHAKNIRIYGATITPFKGNGYYNQYSEL
ncbi:MAG: hypothetical protein LAQ30_32095, partial [Acidobacteriia bacterium]|nr:hypothetical protein [Terriglobia bacterium]